MDSDSSSGPPSVADDASPVQSAPPIQDSASSVTAPSEADALVAVVEDNRVKYTRDELLAFGKQDRCKVFPTGLDLETHLEFRDLDKRVESSALDDVPLKPQWAGFANRGQRPGPPGFGAPAVPFKSRLIDDPIPSPGPEPSHSPPGPGPWGRGPPRTQDKDDKWHEPWNAHERERERPAEHRPERPVEGRGRWGDKLPGADTWRGKEDRWGAPGGGDRGAPPRGERERDAPAAGGREPLGRPRRWEDGHDWDRVDRRPEQRRPDHHDMASSPSENWSDATSSKPRSAITHVDIERERQAFREQHLKSQAAGKQDTRINDMDALFTEVDMDDLMDEEQRAAKGLPSRAPPARSQPAAPSAAPQGIKMSFMDLAKAAAGSGSGHSDKPDAPPGIPNGKVVTLDDLEKRQLQAGAVPAEVAEDAKLARGGAPAAGAKGPPPGMVAPPPGFQADAQASQTLMGLLKKSAPPANSSAPAPSAAPAAPIAAPAAESSSVGPALEAATAPASSSQSAAEHSGLGSLLGGPPGGKPAAGGLSLSNAFATGGGLLGTSIPSSVFSAFGQSKPDEQLAAISSIWASTPAPSTTAQGPNNTKPAPASNQQEASDISSKQAYQSNSGGGLAPNAGAGGQQNPLAALFARAAAQQGQGGPIANAAAGGAGAPASADATMAALLGQLNKAQLQQQQQQQQQQQGQQQKNAMDLLRMMEASKQQQGPGNAAAAALAGLQAKQVQQAGGQNPAQKQLADLLAGLRTGQGQQAVQPSQEQLLQLLASGAIARQQAAGMQGGNPQQNLLEQQLLQQLQQRQQAAARPQGAGPGAGFNPQLLAQLQQAMSAQQQRPGMASGQPTALPGYGGMGARPPAMPTMQHGANPVQALNLQLLQAQAQAQARANPAAQSGAQLLQAMQANISNMQAAQAQAQAQQAAVQGANSLARFFNPAALQAVQAPRMPFPGSQQQQPPPQNTGPTNLAELEKLLQRR